MKTGFWNDEEKTEIKSCVVEFHSTPSITICTEIVKKEYILYGGKISFKKCFKNDGVWYEEPLKVVAEFIKNNDVFENKAKIVDVQFPFADEDGFVFFRCYKRKKE